MVAAYADNNRATRSGTGAVTAGTGATEPVNDFTIHSVQARFVEIDSPCTENIQHIAREHFARVHEHWHAYMFARSMLRDITRFSTYVISILHHVLDSDRA